MLAIQADRPGRSGRAVGIVAMLLFITTRPVRAAGALPTVGRPG